MSYKGKFRPKNHKKYKGDYREVVYRSSWELKFMQYCDTNKSIVKWSSEEIVIPYRSPVDNRIHRYFPDFLIKYQDNNGRRRIMVVEIKPKKETKMPATNPKKRSKSWAYSVRTWAVNQAKWKAAREYCRDRNYEFKIMTEDDLGIK